MRIHRFSGPFVLALALWAQSASAFLDPPFITPVSPVAGEQVSVNIYGGECDLVDDGVVWPPPVTQQGSELSILLTGGHEENPEFCYFNAGNHIYPVGIYPPGTYTLRVDWRYSTFNGWVTQTLGTIPFTVSVAQQQPIETNALSNTGGAGLLLMLIAASLLTLRRKNQSR